MKKIKKLILALGLTSLVQTSYADGFNTLDLIGDSVADMPDCLEYKANKLVLKMVMTFFGPEFFWTLNVSHNSPNWLTMTHNELSDIPFTEYNIILGKPYEKISEIGLQTALSSKSEIGGGRYKYENWGDHQAVQFTETTVIGHPGSMILQMFGIGGLKADGYWVGSGKDKYWHQCKTNGCLEEQNTEVGQGIRESLKNKPPLSKKQVVSKKMSYLTNWKNGKYTNEIFELMDIKAIHDQLKNFQALNSFFQNFGMTFNATAASVGAKFDRVFCPMDIAPYVPYYLSGFDAISWRGGYPVTDPEFSKIILNPLSQDIIGTKVKDPLLKMSFYEQWGHIYPREGSANIQNSAKLAAVAAYRANSVLSDKKRSPLRIYRKPFENTVGVWNKSFPKHNKTTPCAKSSACHRNIANTGIAIQDKGKYAFTSWPRYSCDLADGMTILKIPVNIYITSKVPE